MSLLTCAALFLAACTPGMPKVEGDTHASPADDTSPDDTSPDDTSPDDSSPGDTSPGETGPSGLVSDFAWAVDPVVASLVRLTWRQSAEAAVHAEWSFDEGEWHQSPTKPREAGDQAELVVGIPYQTSAALRLITDTGAGPETAGEWTVTTGDLPTGLPVPELRAADEARWDPTGRYLLGSINQDQGGWNGGRYWMFLLDRRGRFVWAKRALGEYFTIYLRVSKDGDLLWDESTWWVDYDDGLGSRIHRMKIDAVETAVYDAPGMHHAFTELPDGSLVWGAGLDNSEQLLRRSLGGSGDAVTELWDCAPFYRELGLRDWCHTNSIVYVEDEVGDADTFLLSFPTNDTFVLEIDAATAEELRWFGHIPDAWAFDPPDAAFQYQHGVTYTPTGTLLVSSQASASSIEGAVREYALDEEAETLREVWSYGEGDGISAQYAGEAHRLPNGNTLHNFGTTPRVQEITPERTLAWDVAFQGNRLLGRTTWVEDLYSLAP